MFKYIFLLLILSFYQPVFSTEDTISQAVARYLTRIHKYMEAEDWINAENGFGNNYLIPAGPLRENIHKIIHISR